MIEKINVLGGVLLYNVPRRPQIRESLEPKTFVDIRRGEQLSARPLG
jgi:hypothetical protein